MLASGSGTSACRHELPLQLLIVMKLTRKEFEEVVVLALRRIPKSLKKKMENIDVVVEDRASRGLLSEMGLQSPFELLGLLSRRSNRSKGILLWECASR